MLTNEIVLKVFSDYLNRDMDFEVVLTSRGYTVMGFDNRRQDWSTVDYPQRWNAGGCHSRP